MTNADLLIEYMAMRAGRRFTMQELLDLKITKNRTTLYTYLKKAGDLIKSEKIDVDGGPEKHYWVEDKHKITTVYRPIEVTRDTTFKIDNGSIILSMLSKMAKNDGVYTPNVNKASPSFAVALAQLANEVTNASLGYSISQGQLETYHGIIKQYLERLEQAAIVVRSIIHTAELWDNSKFLTFFDLTDEEYAQIPIVTTKVIEDNSQ